MPTATARLALPVPTSGDPANAPAQLLSLADGLDAGADSNYDGVAVIISPPVNIGGAPGSPIPGTIYPVAGSPPYMLYYTGEVTTGTGNVPAGYRNIGQAGSNAAVMSNTSPAQTALAGTQPVWAPLDHRHASLPWSNNQTTAAWIGATTSDGNANAFARANHSHGPSQPGPGLIAGYGSFPTATNITSGSYAPIPGGGCSVTMTTGALVLVTISSQLILTYSGSGAGEIGFSVSGASSIPPGANGVAIFYANDTGVPQIGASSTWPVVVTPGSNTFTVEAEILESVTMSMADTYIIVQLVGAT